VYVTAERGGEQIHLIGLGMMMLNPPVISLPVKLLLFVMVDGWALVCGGVATSFR
jgi:flagellar biosynthetic protein FliP